MRILVTGAAGMLGHKVVAVASGRGHDVVAADLEQFDITDAEATRAFLEAERPDVVVHCAAYTAVDRAEEDEERALAINGLGSANVAGAAAALDARVVAVSTDYVFDGAVREEPWVESDPTGPLGAYGRTKLAGEQAVLEASDRNAVVRTAWLFGAGGPNFPDTMLRLAAERGVVDVVSDQVGSPTWTGHLAPALVDAAEDASRTGVFHAAGAGSCSWYELAVATFYYKGTDVDVHAVDTAAFPRPAPRPAYSVLGSERGALALTLPSWRDGLHGHLDDNEETPS